MVREEGRRRRIKIKSGIYRLPVNVIDDIVLSDSYVKIDVEYNSQMIQVIDNIFIGRDPPADKAVIVTDNPNVVLIAMGFGLMVEGKEETKDEDGGIN